MVKDVNLSRCSIESINLIEIESNWTSNSQTAAHKPKYKVLTGDEPMNLPNRTNEDLKQVTDF